MKSLKGKIKFIIPAVVICIIIAAFFIFGKGTSPDDEFVTTEVKRGTLVVDVTEAGSVEASDSLDIRSEVEGRTTIISIVPEGYMVTPQDVENEKVLVELDSSELKKKLDQQEITVQQATAELTDAKESLNIQENKNESNLKQGQLKVKFALMDLEKYLGEEAAGKVIQEEADLSCLIDEECLGGEALQKRREHETTISLSEEELARAEEKLVWTRKLEAEGFVTHNELLADELALKQKQVSLEKAKTAFDLFKRYEFIKQVEKLRSDDEEAKKELERIEAQNRSELSRAEAKLRSSESTFNSKKDQYDKLKEQIEKCKIVATKPGIIIYGGSDNPWARRQVEEGAEVHERQEIISIPESSSMIAKVKIHESVITRIEEGLPTEITLDALPDKTFKGTVKKVSTLPDSEQRWINPNLKVYMTEVNIEGTHPNLKPGMSAQVRIIMDTLENVCMVPLQAVYTSGDKSVCFVSQSSGYEPRSVKTGEYNDKYMEIKEGLEEGEKVILNIASLVDEIEESAPDEKIGKESPLPTDETITEQNDRATTVSRKVQSSTSPDDDSFTTGE